MDHRSRPVPVCLSGQDDFVLSLWLRGEAKDDCDAMKSPELESTTIIKSSTTEH